MIDLQSKDYDLQRLVSKFIWLAEDASIKEDFFVVDEVYCEILDLAQEILVAVAEGVGIFLV